jgi:hypothetical protein
MGRYLIGVSSDLSYRLILSGLVHCLHGHYRLDALWSHRRLPHLVARLRLHVLEYYPSKGLSISLRSKLSSSTLTF